MAKDLWELESDIFTGYEGTITEATFRFNEYGGQFSLTLDEIDGRENPTWENFKLPPGWESVDGGETIQRVSGDDKGIVKSSQMGKLLASVAALPGAREALGDNAPVNAAAWIGTRWRWEVTELGKGGSSYKFTNDKGEEVAGKTKDKNYPVEFLGKDDAVKTEAGGNGKVDSLSVLSTLNNPVLESQIAEWAKQLTHREWFNESFKLVSQNGVSAATHPDLISAMGGRGLYESLGGQG